MDDSNTRLLELKMASFEKKLSILIKTKEKLSWTLSELHRENAALKEVNLNLKEEVKEIKKKYSTLEKDFNKSKTFVKIVTSKLTPTAGLSELKESVERYIQEIDKCIEILEDTL